MQLKYYDSNGAVVKVDDTGVLGSSTQWKAFTLNSRAPANAATMEICLTAEKNQSGVYGKVYYDKLLLKVLGLNANESFDYTGKKEDEGTGLKYFGARFYDPEVGRFLTVDPKKDGENWLIYCRNNPLKYIDPTGQITVAVQGSGSASFMGSIGGFGGVVVDGNGNVGLTGSLAVGGGTPSAGLGVTISITTAENISTLSGLGVEGGISAAPVVGPGIGVDFIGGNGYYGVNINIGLKGTPTVFEGHGRINGAGVIPLNGVFADLGKQAKEMVVNQLKDVWSKLPDEIKQQIEDYLGTSFNDIIDSITSDPGNDEDN